MSDGRDVLLAATGLGVRFDAYWAVKDVSLAVPAGPFGLGLIGEPGSGKSTIARALAGVQEATEGAVTFEGRDVRGLVGADMEAFRRSVGLLVQDAGERLDPGTALGAPGDARVGALWAELGLDAALAERLPHQVSRGERQRAALARVLGAEPRVLLLDEPTSALDVAAQARVLELLERRRRERALSYLVISHDLAVVGRLCDFCVVVKDGVVVEQGPTAQVLDDPQHPYTRQLRAAVPGLPGPQRAG